jgi:hypothetical protein
MSLRWPGVDPLSGPALMPPPNDDDELKAYRASLKTPSLTVQPRLVAIFGGVIAFILLLGWTFSWKSDPPDPPKVTVASAAPSEAPAPPPPPTPRELTMEALQGVAGTYAPLEGTALPEAAVKLAKGRKVLFVLQSLGFDPETARLMRSPERMPTKIPALPRGFELGKLPELAVAASEVGVVVLMRQTDSKVGTYTGGKEAALETTMELVAILVPEKKRIAAFKHVLHPKGIATRVGSGDKSVLLGTEREEDESWMNKAALDLYEGRAPESTEGG